VTKKEWGCVEGFSYRDIRSYKLCCGGGRGKNKTRVDRRGAYAVESASEKGPREKKVEGTFGSHCGSAKQGGKKKSPAGSCLVERGQGWDERTKTNKRRRKERQLFDQKVLTSKKARELQEQASAFFKNLERPKGTTSSTFFS